MRTGDAIYTLPSPSPKMTTPVTELCVPLVSARRSCSIPYFLRLRPPSNGYAAPDVYRVMTSLATPVSVVTILPTRNPPPLCGPPPCIACSVLRRSIDSRHKGPDSLARRRTTHWKLQKRRVPSSKRPSAMKPEGAVTTTEDIRGRQPVGKHTLGGNGHNYVIPPPARAFDAA
ncbi:hypothetical protein GQ607_017380 [Colletotrichum asianum]|uniref:Uncharacterized protein n=1 Tax=Colletotrichum asianum TaxID=702518 RepID=A0A8H3VZ71_9PEZI|nr:hypothetical protein GQ607_017380 [Colletotrichum asianum]